MMKLCLLSFLLVSCWSACPEWSCSDDLNANVCAKYVDSMNIHINYDTCTTGGCSFSEVLAWSNTAERDDTYLCNTDDVWTQEESTDSTLLNCYATQVSKDLAEGTYPKQCENVGDEDENCKLEDDTYGECECGLDGRAYCVPDKSSEIYEDYIDECKDNDWKLESWDHYWFWYLKRTHYIDYITAYTCSRAIFEEFKAIDDLDYTDNHGVFLALGFALLSLII